MLKNIWCLLFFSLIQFCHADDISDSEDPVKAFEEIIRIQHGYKDLPEFPKTLRKDEYPSFIKYNLIVESAHGHQFVTLKPTLETKDLLMSTPIYRIIYQRQLDAPKINDFIANDFFQARVVKTLQSDTDPLKRIHWKQKTSSILEELRSTNDLEYTLSLIKLEIKENPQSADITKGLFNSKIPAVARFGSRFVNYVAITDPEVFEFLLTSTNFLSPKKTQSSVPIMEMVNLMEELVNRRDSGDLKATDSLIKLGSNLKSEQLVDIMMFLIQSSQFKPFLNLFKEDVLTQNLQQKDFDKYVNWFIGEDYPSLLSLEHITKLPLQKFLKNGRAYRIIAKLMESKWHVYGFMFTEDLLKLFSAHDMGLLIDSWMELIINGKLQALAFVKMNTIKSQIDGSKFGWLISSLFKRNMEHTSIELLSERDILTKIPSKYLEELLDQIVESNLDRSQACKLILDSPKLAEIPRIKWAIWVKTLFEDNRDLAAEFLKNQFVRQLLSSSTKQVLLRELSQNPFKSQSILETLVQTDLRAYMSDKSWSLLYLRYLYSGAIDLAKTISSEQQITKYFDLILKENYKALEQMALNVVGPISESSVGESISSIARSIIYENPPQKSKFTDSERESGFRQGREHGFKTYATQPFRITQRHRRVLPGRGQTLTPGLPKRYPSRPMAPTQHFRFK